MIVTLAEAKSYLGRTGDTDDDTLITALIVQAGAQCESYSGRVFTNAERVENVSGGGEALILGFPPILALEDITSIIDRTTALLDEYDLDDIDADLDAGLIYISSGAKWGAGRRRWEVTYDGGFDGAPADVKQAALIIIANLFENRTQASGSLGDRSIQHSPEGIPEAARMLLHHYRVYVF